MTNLIGSAGVVGASINKKIRRKVHTKVIRNEDLSYYRKSSKKHEERIKSKINSKDPVLEILDEDDDYEKPIIIGVAKK